ncbi:MAG: hypothetical protein JOZ08_25200 [Verrucomicrobia bacterium]|nr:hypothetical protein [Verrucomicrobiota bacterium]MBV8277275.1 hypothetical protein [Verrucomicrobiota bacterium]
MKKALIVLLCATAIIPLVSALTVVPKSGTDEELGRIQEATDEAAAELDSEQVNYYSVANQIHARITEVTNDTRDDHQLIRMHWTAHADVWIRAFKLRFTYFDENRKPIKNESRWMWSPNEDGSFNMIPPHSPIDEWHELTLPTDEANRLKSVTVAVELAYESD